MVGENLLEFVGRNLRSLSSGFRERCVEDVRSRGRGSLCERGDGETEQEKGKAEKHTAPPEEEHLTPNERCCQTNARPHRPGIRDRELQGLTSPLSPRSSRSARRAISVAERSNPGSRWRRLCLRPSLS